jgi:hypothetical protein
VTTPQHESLEALFFAAVPPQRAPWLRRASYWLLLRMLSIAPLRALFIKRKGT